MRRHTYPRMCPQRAVVRQRLCGEDVQDGSLDPGPVFELDKSPSFLFQSPANWVSKWVTLVGEITFGLPLKEPQQGRHHQKRHPPIARCFSIKRHAKNPPLVQRLEQAWLINNTSMAMTPCTRLTFCRVVGPQCVPQTLKDKSQGQPQSLKEDPTQQSRYCHGLR